MVENFSTIWQNIEIQLIILQTLKVKTFDQSQTKLQTGEWNTWNTFELILIHRFFTNFNLSKMKQIKWGTSRQCEKRCKRSWRVGGMGWCPFMDRMTISRRVMQFTRTIIAAWSSALMYYTNRHTHTVCHNNTGYNRNPKVNKKDNFVMQLKELQSPKKSGKGVHRFTKFSFFGNWFFKAKVQK